MKHENQPSLLSPFKLPPSLLFLSNTSICSHHRLLLTLSLLPQHTCELEEERERVEKSGGWVERVGGVERVNGRLAVSRSFGDKELADLSVVSCVPSVKVVERDELEFMEFELEKEGTAGEMEGEGFREGEGRGGGKEISPRYIVMATDGLWDVLSNSEAATMVGMELETGGSWQTAAERLTREAYVRGSKDNIGVSIVRIE